MFVSRSSIAAWATLAISVPLVNAANATFYPKINLTDTSGTLIQAHGGAILRSASSDDNNWYWFGEDKTGLTNSGRYVTCETDMMQTLTARLQFHRRELLPQQRLCRLGAHRPCSISSSRHQHLRQHDRGKAESHLQQQEL